MQSNGRAGRCAPLPRQGLHPVRAGRRHRRHGPDRGRGPATRRVIGFDMGGTSTRRVPLRGASSSWQYENRGGRGPDAGAHAEHPHRRGWRRLDPGVATAAGTGSARTRRGRTRDPPATGGGGPLTVTDDAERSCWAGSSRAPFPGCSGRAATSRWTPGWWPPGSMPWPSGSRRPPGPAQRRGGVAAGFLDIAVANMANAIKKISVQRGHDITRYVLATFGGAGGQQHACAGRRRAGR